MKVPAQAIKDLNEESAYNIFGNTVTNHDNAAFLQQNPTFNPIDKLIEVYEENRKLYERLLQAEKDKVEMLEKLWAERK